MARDAELFSLLARSMDAVGGEDVPHRVIVPGRDLPVFRRFARPGRDIIAQEDVLPLRLFRVPAMKYLAPLSASFRRPIYLDSRLRMVRGWILQQLLKIEMSRTATEDMVLHVDSDVFFFRRFGMADGFVDGLPRYFRAVGKTANPDHSAWLAAAGRILGIGVAEPHLAHYVENCVPWVPGVVQAMTTRIEATHGRPWPEVLVGEATISEYYLYGVFVDLLRGTGGLAEVDNSLCLSFWSDGAIVPETHFAKARPDHVAMAVQSTHALSFADRVALYEKARAHFVERARATP